MRKFLHVGCGAQNKTYLRGFNSDQWQEIRFDIDPAVQPDITGTLTDMSAVASESVDAIFSAHNIEHIYAHEVPVALTEFIRVLKPGGFVVMTCPDLQSVCEAVVNDKLLEPLYESPAGAISPIDILYGHRGYMQQGNLYMAHKCGFTYSALSLTFLQYGFKSLIGARRPEHYDLWMVAFKDETSEDQMRAIAPAYLP